VRDPRVHSRPEEECHRENRSPDTEKPLEEFWMLTDSSWGAVQRTIEDFFSNKGVQEWWQLRKGWHTIQFAQVVDQMIVRACEPTGFAHYGPS
jgi:hypothetical protein